MAAWFSAILLALCSIACSSGGSASKNYSNCSTSLECSLNQSCINSHCIPKTEIVVRVSPNTDGLYEQDFGLYSEGLDNSLFLSRAVTVSGSIKTITGGTISNYLEGYQIEMTSVSRLMPQIPFEKKITQTIPKGLSSFSVSAPEGTWNLVIYPMAGASGNIGPAVVPLYKQIEISAFDENINLVLSSDELNLIKGTFSCGTGCSKPFRFQVIDSQNGNALSQSLVFTPGSFSLYSAKSSQNSILKIIPDPVLAAGEILPSKQFILDNGAVESSFDLGGFGSPVEVTGILTDPKGLPVRADILIEGKVNGGGTYAATAQSNSSGHFSVKLLPSMTGEKYRLSVRPFSDSLASSMTTAFSVGEVSQDLGAIICPTKMAVSGVVRSQASIPLAGIIVRIEPDKDATNPGRSLIRNLVTDNGGFFSSLVEPGSYQIAAIASNSKMLPWGFKSIEVTNNLETEVIIPNGEMLFGTVDSLNEKAFGPLSNASVAIYKIDSGKAPAKIYETLTDSVGQFLYIIPR